MIVLMNHNHNHQPSTNIIIIIIIILILILILILIILRPSPFCLAEVDKAIGRSKSDRRVMTTMDQGGRPAVSLIRALATDVQREMLLVEVRPRTDGGRFRSWEVEVFWYWKLVLSKSLVEGNMCFFWFLLFGMWINQIETTGILFQIPGIWKDVESQFDGWKTWQLQVCNDWVEYFHHNESPKGILFSYYIYRF